VLLCCSATGGTVWPAVVKDDLIVDPYPLAGNAAMFINDYRLDPHNKQASRSAGKSNVNVAFLQVTYKGWPYIFIKASATIKCKDEFILDYGNGYWTDSVNLHNQFEKALPHLEALHDSKDELELSITTAAAAGTAAAAAAAAASAV
jgi:hypothetical protein